jgi:hypothetical protein
VHCPSSLVGRAELPESLKTLFRPVSMVVPDLALICEIMLMAEGFQMSKILSRKCACAIILVRLILAQGPLRWAMQTAICKSAVSICVCAASERCILVPAPAPLPAVHHVRDNSVVELTLWSNSTMPCLLNTCDRRFVILYKLCEDLLSKSRHYDWKLRAIKTTLYVAGSMKRGAPELTEDKVWKGEAMVEIEGMWGR